MEYGPNHPTASITQEPLPTSCTPGTLCGVQRDGGSLNTGVNTGLLSTSNAARITEGGRRGRRRSFEALHSSFSLKPLSIPPILHPFLHPCPPPTSSLSLSSLPLQKASPATLCSLHPRLVLLSIMHQRCGVHFGDGQSMACVSVYVYAFTYQAAVRWAVSMTAYGICE